MISNFASFLTSSNWDFALEDHYGKLLELTGVEPQLQIASPQTLVDHMTDAEDSHNGSSLQEYLRYLGGGPESEDALIGLIAMLFNHIRRRCATDERDRLYALYGIVSRVCVAGKIPNPLPYPDYTITVAEAIMSNIKSILSHSKVPLFLYFREDPDERKLGGLSSWASDMTVLGLNSIIDRSPGDNFDASNGAELQLLPAPDLNTLCLIGHHVDTIDRIAAPNCYWKNQPVALEGDLLFLKSLPEFYFTGELIFEAFLRTLVIELGEQDTPIASSIYQGVSDWLEFEYSSLLRSQGREGTAAFNDASAYLQDLLQKVRSIPGARAAIPSHKRILEGANEYLQHNGVNDLDPRADGELSESRHLRYVSEAEARSAEFIHKLRFPIHSTRLFCTEGGLIGFGPRWMQVGDQIFVIQGGQVPFLLRRVADAGGQAQHVLVGEAYVHGIMHGQALQRGVPITMDLAIV